MRFEIFFLICFRLSICQCMVINSNGQNSGRVSLEAQIRNALELSRISASSRTSDSIKTAEAAISAWENILVEPKQTQSQQVSATLPPKIRTIGLVFYGHALSQCGRDGSAVQVYSEAITLLTKKKEQDKSTTNDYDLESLTLYREAGTARGWALQRLQRYQEARDQFEECLQLTYTLESRDESKEITATIVSAVTCSLRLGDILFAKNLLEKFISKDAYVEKKTAGCEDLYGLLATCLWIEHGSKYSRNKETHENKSLSIQQPPVRILDLLRISVSGKSPSPLYKWLYMIAQLHSSNMISNDKNTLVTNTNQEEVFLRLAAINQSPFDSPQLIEFDNKISLHNYLQKKKQACSFWPEGYILPNDLRLFRERLNLNDLEQSLLENDNLEKEQNSWILKQGAGYGSHGNKIVSATQALSRSSVKKEGSSNSWNDYFDKDGEPILCQKLVHPPLLLGEDGRKFSLRVYVVLMPSLLNLNARTLQTKDEEIRSQEHPWHVFLSSEGLVKLASTPYDKNHCSTTDSKSTILDSMHMTNSGREKNMQQFDFHYLQMQFQQRGFDYDALWSKITHTVSTTMTKDYNENGGDANDNSYCSDESPRSLNTSPFKVHMNRFTTEQLCIPKILGFDFVVSENLQPWLLEVNRFPGLEPRDSCDYRVKHKVVEDAWRLAADYAVMSCDEQSASTYYSSLLSQFGLDALVSKHDQSRHKEEISLTRIL